MQPTEILSSEHRVIEQVLACLEKIAAQALAQGRLERQPAADALDFFRNFADRCHHGKEEAHVFPALEAHGFPRNGGPTGVMISEHEAGRAYVRAMSADLLPAAAGDTAAVERFAQNAQAYVGLLQEHIHKEDHCLFPMVNASLSPQDQQALLAHFEQVETHEMGTGTHEKFLKMASDLAARYPVPAACSAAAHAGCGCRH